MTCHSCSHSEAIMRGEYDSKPWNELPCASCKLTEDTFYSSPYDDAHPPASVVYYLTSDLRNPATGSPLIPADVLSQFVKELLSLPLELRDIVSLRYQGLPYKEIGRQLGITTQCAEMRHKRAMRMWPALEALFPYKTAKRKRRLASR